MCRTGVLIEVIISCIFDEFTLAKQKCELASLTRKAHELYFVCKVGDDDKI